MFAVWRDKNMVFPSLSIRSSLGHMRIWTTALFLKKEHNKEGVFYS